MNKKFTLLLVIGLLFFSACSQKTTKENDLDLTAAKNLKMISMTEEELTNKLKEIEKKADECISNDDFLKWQESIDNLTNILNSNLTILTIKTYLNSHDKEAFDLLLKNEQMLNQVNESEVKSYRTHLKKDYANEVKTFLSTYSPALLNEITVSQNEETRDTILSLKNQLSSVKNEYIQKERDHSTIYNGKSYPIDELESEKNKEEIEKKYYQELLAIYSNQIKIEKELAAQLGYDSVFNMYHQEYNRPYQQSDVEKYFALTKKYFSPLIEKMPPQEDLKAVNTKKIATEEIGKIFKKIDNSLYQSWQEMLDKNLYDIDYDEDKPTGFAAVYYNPYYKTPFLVGNFNNKTSDLEVFIHEFGHFFANILQKNTEVVNNDIHEIYSQCLELLISLKLDDIAPQAKELFVQQILMSQLISTTMIQEFQTRIYEEDDLTLEKMEAINKKMLLEYYGDDHVEDKYSWSQLILSERPLSMSEYFLGAVTALQVHQAANNNYQEAFKKYMEMVNNPKQDNLVNIVTEAGFKSPSEEATIKEVANYLETFFSK